MLIFYVAFQFDQMFFKEHKMHVFIFDFKMVCLMYLQCTSRLDDSHILAPACVPRINHNEQTTFGWDWDSVDDNFLSFPFPESLCRVMSLLSNSIYIGLHFPSLYSLHFSPSMALKKNV